MPAKSGKKSAAAKTAKKSGQRYEYTDLAKTQLSTGTATHNVYGVIIDATFPYKTTKDLYVLSLKIVDPSLNTGSKGGDYATVTFYATAFEDLPIVLRIGDIIRVHRATIRMWKGHRQFNVATQWTGSWTAWSTDKEPAEEHTKQDNGTMGPATSRQKPTIEKQDLERVDALRKWAHSWLGSNDGVTKDMYTPLSKAKQEKEVDVVAKVLHIHEMDQYTDELKIKDHSGQTWYVLSLKLKNPHITVGAAIRIRCATWDETCAGKNVLVLQHYSNIMTFISGTKLGKSLASITDDWSDNKKALAGDAALGTAVYVSEVDRKWANTPYTSLANMFSTATNGETYRTRFCVVRVDPGDSRDAVKSWDSKTGKLSSAAKSSGDLAWNVQLTCKDGESFSNANVYRILNYSHEGLGNNFFGKVANLHTDNSARARFEKHAATLQRFNVWVDAVVECRNGWFVIKDTRLRN